MKRVLVPVGLCVCVYKGGKISFAPANTGQRFAHSPVVRSFVELLLRRVASYRFLVVWLAHDAKPRILSRGTCRGVTLVVLLRRVASYRFLVVWLAHDAKPRILSRGTCRGVTLVVLYLRREERIGEQVFSVLRLDARPSATLILILFLHRGAKLLIFPPHSKRCGGLVRFDRVVFGCGAACVRIVRVLLHIISVCSDSLSEW